MANGTPTFRFLVVIHWMSGGSHELARRGRQKESHGLEESLQSQVRPAMELSRRKCEVAHSAGVDSTHLIPWPRKRTATLLRQFDNLRPPVI